MGNAETLFKKIQSGGLKYIEDELVEKERENDFLECKTKGKPNEWSPGKDDLKNFAKALSGFANTEGGVLIFGLDARKNVEDGIDKINEINLLVRSKNLHRD